MSMLEDLRQFERSFLRYAELLDEIGDRAGGVAWFSAATREERREVERLRYELNRLYGRIRPAIAEANGGIPILGNAYTTAGEVVQVALAEPSDNPWIEAALDGTRQLIAMTLGYYERHADRRAAGEYRADVQPAGTATQPPRGRTARALGSVIRGTTQQIVVAVVSALILAGVGAVTLAYCGIALR